MEKLKKYNHKPIWVKPKTHAKVKVKAAKQKLTMNDLIEGMLQE